MAHISDIMKGPDFGRPFSKWFNQPGAYVLVDGQFGSTGKGLLAAYIAQHSRGKITKITTNAGPNSGHTGYFDHHEMADNKPGMLCGQEKIVTKQVPVASVWLDLATQVNPEMWPQFDTIINAGAVIDHDILLDELGKWMQADGNRVLIHPCAAHITEAARHTDKAVTTKIAGTGQGVGPAMAQKLMRTYGRSPIIDDIFGGLPVYDPERPNYKSWDNIWDWDRDVVFVETAQGFSLGLNSSQFYPFVTSRECSVGQALADARIPAQMLRKVVATFRTFPIRVGNTEGSSGDWYPDQEETSWEALGLEPELTTVTKRVRRVASWSRIQFREAVATNRPDVLFLNFMNYLKEDQIASFMANVEQDYSQVMGCYPEDILIGYGPYNNDIRSWREVPF